MFFDYCILFCVLGGMGLKNSDGQMEGAKSGKSSNGFIPTSFRALSRIVSSGASTVASTVRSAASAIVDRDNDSTHDQVHFPVFFFLKNNLNSYPAPSYFSFLFCIILA